MTSKPAVKSSTSPPARVKTTRPAKWYQYPMVWMIIALPMIAVVASLTTVVIAYQNAPEIIPISQDAKP